MNTIREVYLQPEFFNARLRATVPGAWVAEYDNGCTVAICRESEARNASEARAIAQQRQ